MTQEFNVIPFEDYAVIVDKNHLTEMPKNIYVYSIRYKNVIRFAEVENSYEDECYEIIATIDKRLSKEIAV